jgi:hypothetical protein
MKKSELKTIAVLVFIVFTLFAIGVSAFDGSLGSDVTVKIITSATIEDASGVQIANTVKITDQKAVVEIQNSPIQTITFTDIPKEKAVSEINKLQIDTAPLPEETPKENAVWTTVYAIDPTKVNFSEATVTVNATGTTLYKCKEWNFSEQFCEGTWMLFKENLTPGELYTFELTPEDPGFGEIIAVDAEHLDSEYNVISNIYNDIKTNDGVWSEPIYQNEFVRVTFAEDLTDGRMIDVYASSNNTYAYFEIYEAGTTHLVGRSGIFAGAELQYITVSNLTTPTDIFDFKIVKYVHDPTDETTDVDPAVNSFITFDYIHDDVINSTHANGLAVYAESGVQTPRYRVWNNTNNNFSIERTNTNSVGANIQWVVVRANHERDEFIVGTEDTTNDVNIQIVNATRNWTNLVEVSIDVPNSATRAFDIGIEEISGNALIVYENSSVSDQRLKYRIWNGSAYSAEQTLNTNISGGINWVKLVPKTNSNHIMLLAHNTTTGLWAILWNGTNFVSSTNQTLSRTTTTAVKEAFDFAWESSSGDGIVFYAEGTNVIHRNYTAATGIWSGTELISNAPKTSNAIRVCADPTSDYIGLTYSDTNSDANARVWNGTRILPTPPTSDGSAEATGTNNDNQGCVWKKDGTKAMFLSVNQNALSLQYTNFTKPNTWTPTSLGSGISTVNFASDDIEGMRITEHPTTDEFMVLAEDLLEDLTAIRWNGTAFVTLPTGATPLETTTQTLNGAQEDAMFEYDHYDPAPNVSGLLANTSVQQFDIVNITVNVTDNIRVDTVLANITFPNGTTNVFSMSNITPSAAQRYNFSFNQTSIIGTYTIRIIANDTRTHNNTNNTETRTFTVTTLTDNIFPAVTNLKPIANNITARNSIVNVSATITDNIAVDVVFANVTYPNNVTKEQIRLVKIGNIYNYSFANTSNEGYYNITFIANDTANNINSTEKTNFTVDSTGPTVATIKPTVNSAQNTESTINISATVTDEWLSVDTVFANITYPDNTTKEQLRLVKVGNIYNFSFANTTQQGTYNITFIANDTFNNLNTTEKTNVTLTPTDTGKPVVTNLKPVANNITARNSIVNVSATVTDNIAVDVVLANITYPDNTTKEQLQLAKAGNIYNFSFANTSTEGYYNVTFIANDTSNNINSSEKTNFTVDSTGPTITTTYPRAWTNQSLNSVLNISATVTDQWLNVDTVFANVTYPDNSTKEQLQLVKVGNMYNFSFRNTTQKGVYNITFIANDTFNNLNTTEKTNATIDGDPPAVTTLKPIANNVTSVNSIVNISATVIDNLGVDRVLANITYPNNITKEQVYLEKVNNIYNYSFANTSNEGYYNITFIANDTVNNLNTTEKTNFTIDSTGPTVSVLRPVANTNQTNGSVLNISATVTDQWLNVDIVLANVTYPDNTTKEQLQLIKVGNIYNFSFMNTTQTGVYNVTFIANDTFNNLNTTEKTNITIYSIDTLKPSVINLRPHANNLTARNSIVNVSATVIDDVAIATVYANITFSNGITKEQVQLQKVGNIYNFSYGNTSTEGDYNVTFTATDTSGNINDTEKTNFTVDSTGPIVTTIRPIANANQTNNSIINISATVTDQQLDVDTVFANITFPNGITKEQLTLEKIGNIYNFSFANTTQEGVYNITFIANDTFNNLNTTEKTNITLDGTIPAISINAPVDWFNTSSQAVNFVFTPTDNLASSIICNLTVDNTLNATNNSINNGTSTTIYGSGYSEGAHNWNVTCTDGAGNSNTSSRRRFTIDLTAPAFNSLTTIPSTADALDPNAPIAFYANVTDSGTAVSTVYLQQKLINASDFVNVTMTFNTSNELYETSYTPTVNGTYNFRVYAKDSVDNNAVSNVINKSIEYERSWTRTPMSDAVGANLNQNLSIINITLNNTGDFSLNFTITSSYTNTVFNTTFPIQLTAGEARIIEAYAVAPATIGTTLITFETTATPNADPSAYNTSLILAVTEGQPYVAASFVTIPTSATQGDTIFINAKVKNIGTGNATNGTLFFTLPSDWTITGGELNNSLGKLIAGDELERSINIYIPTTAISGLRTVLVNTTARNESNVDLVTLGLVSGDTQTVSVLNLTPLLGTGPSSVPAVVPSGVVSGTPAKAVTGSVVSGATLTPSISKQLIDTTEHVEIVRGNNMNFPLKITNIYKDAVIKNVKISVEGYLAQYLSWEPLVLEEIPFDETHEFTIYVSAPGYLSKEEHDLLVTITADIIQKQIRERYNRKTKQIENIAEYKTLKLVETRHVTLVILETSVVEAEQKYEKAQQILKEFEQKEIGTQTLSQLVADLQAAYDAQEYERVEQLYQQIDELSSNAFEAYTILQELEEKAAVLESQGYDMGTLQDTMALAYTSFNQENFASALHRAKEAQLYSAVAVEQQINITAFVKQHALAILTSISIAGVAGFFIERKLFLATVARRLRMLKQQEKELSLLRVAAQTACFNEHKITTQEYHKLLYEYESTIESIRKQKIELQKRQLRITTPEEFIRFLLDDNKEIRKNIQEAQTKYYGSHSITRQEYKDIVSLYKEQLAENEKQIELISTRLLQEVTLQTELKQKIAVEKKTFWQEAYHRHFKQMIVFFTDEAQYWYHATKSAAYSGVSYWHTTLNNFHEYYRHATAYHYGHTISKARALIIVVAVITSTVLMTGAFSIIQSMNAPQNIVTGYAIVNNEHVQFTTTKQTPTTALSSGDIYEMIQNSKQSAALLKEQGYDIAELERQITLAEIAFNRGDSESALVRIQEARVYQSISVEQQFHLSIFLKKYLYWLLGVIISTAILVYFIEKKIFKVTLAAQLKRLEQHEKEISILKEKAQEEFFKNKKISSAAYHKMIYTYDETLKNIRKQRIYLKRREQCLITAEENILFLEQENEAVLQKIYKLQEDYFIYDRIQGLKENEKKRKRKIPIKEYTAQMAWYKQQLITNEKELSMIQTALQKREQEKEELKQKINKNKKYVFHELYTLHFDSVLEYITDYFRYSYLLARYEIKNTYIQRKNKKKD